MSLLVDPNDSVFVIIDVQPLFLDRVDEQIRAGVIERIAFLTLGARFCGIPIVASVESPQDWGGLHPDLVEVISATPL